MGLQPTNILEPQNLRRDHALNVTMLSQLERRMPRRVTAKTDELIDSLYTGNSVGAKRVQAPFGNRAGPQDSPSPSPSPSGGEGSLLRCRGSSGRRPCGISNT